jgi:colanic acid biosynthesis glycosyl transferase WcaI
LKEDFGKLSSNAAAPGIWVVSELYYPEETSTGYFVTGIAEGLAAHHRVHVICSQPTYSGRGTKAPWCEVWNGVQIKRCWSTTMNKDLLLLRVLNLCTISFSIFFRVLASAKKGDAVLVVTNPAVLPFLISIACRLKHAKCLLLIHDVYPEVLAAAGMMKPASIGYRGIERLTRLLYKSVRRIIVLGRDVRQLIESKMENGRGKIVIIPNWGDIQRIRPMPRNHNELLQKMGIPDKFVVQYCGNMGRTHGVECLVDVAQKLKNVQMIHFLLAGWGAKREWLEREVRSRDLTNVTVLPSPPRTNLPHLLNACDVSIIPFVQGMKGVSVPSRMYDVMAAGKPIIASAESDSELAMVVREEQVGWVVPPDDLDRMVEAILEARSDPERLAEMGKRARSSAEGKFSRQHAIDAYREMFLNLNDSAR